MTSKNEIKKRFFNSLKRGTGEAILIAKENPSIDFSNHIINGVLKNYAYDGQSEPERATYIYDLISLSNQKEKIRKALFQALKTEKEDTWTLTHLFALAKNFAENGDKEARKAIYKRFLNNRIECSDWVGYSEILELDGFNGLVYIAEKYGKLMKRDPEVWEDDMIISHFQDENKNINVKEELEVVAQGNEYVKIYLDRVKQIKETRNANYQEREERQKTYENIIDEILDKPRLPYKKYKQLTETEIKLVADALVKEQKEDNIEKFLFVFTHNQFPLDSTFILELAKQKKSLNIRDRAIDALEHLKSDKIREFALEKISNNKSPRLYLNILVANYKEGDSKLLTQLVNKTNNEWFIESYACSATHIFEKNKTPECKEPLEALYKKMNCGLHRKYLVEIMIENNVLSDKLREELIFDSNLETRELIKNCR